jgi:hypothetical protein
VLLQLLNKSSFDVLFQFNTYFFENFRYQEGTTDLEPIKLVYEPPVAKILYIIVSSIDMGIAIHFVNLRSNYIQSHFVKFVLEQAYACHWTEPDFQDAYRDRI